MAVGTEQGLTEAIKIDVKRMHETWMEIVYPRQLDAEDTVLGKWKPDGGLQLYLYRLWSTIGVFVVSIVYPLVLSGYFVRFQTRRLNLTAARLGLVGVVLVFVLLWGGLSALVVFRLGGAFSAGGVVAFVAASSVAIVAAALSFVFWRTGGRSVTVLFAYPFAVTAIFLPPIVAGLYSTAVADIVFTWSDSLASQALDRMPSLIGNFLAKNYERDALAHVIIWFGVSIPVGWILGVLVTLADLVRPTAE